MSVETITPLEVKDGDILFMEGFRVMACLPYIDEGFEEPTARYTLISKPNEEFPIDLPKSFEGMASGGNKLARIGREIKS